MLFSCDRKNFKFFSIEEIIKIILSKKIFVELPQNKENKVNIETKNEIKDNSNKIIIKRVKYNILGKDTSDIQCRTHNYVKEANIKIEKLIKKFKVLMNNKNEILKNGFEQKLKNIYFSLCKNYNDFI